MKWEGHVACMGEDRKLYKVLVGKLKGGKPLSKLRLRWQDGIKMDLREMGWEGVEWIHLTQDRDRWWVLMNMVMNLWILAPQS
jgi:hypothetical protein